MRSEANSRVQTQRRTARPDVHELLGQLQPLDIQLLNWLLRYPFQRAEDLAIAVGTSIATTYRHLITQQNLGLIEGVMPGALGARACWLYHLSNLGLHVLAAYEQMDPASLAQAWRTDEHGLLRLLPRLAMLVTVQDCINGLVTNAPEALAHLGRRSEVRWHWVRDFAHRFSYRENIIHCKADAGLVFRIRPVTTDGRGKEVSWYSMFLLLDVGITDLARVKQRLKRLLCYRECAERWPIYQHFPLVLVLVASSHRKEHWQRAALEVATALQVAPLAGAITCLGAEQDTAVSNPWRFAWQTLSTHTSCRLRDLLAPMPVEAIPPRVLDQDGVDETKSVDAHADNIVPVVPPRLTKIIAGNFTARAEQAKRELAGNCRDEGEVIALLGLLMGRRHLDLLDLVFDHPLLSGSEMAALLDLESSSVERYLRELRGMECIDTEVAAEGGQRWRLSERGLRLMAATHHVSIQSIAVASTPSDTEEETGLVQRGVDVLLHRLEHTAGVYGFFASLSQAARQERAQQHEHALLWWEAGAACERRYRDHDHWHNLRPDAMGEYQAEERWVRFWLEWDRATMGTRDLVAKFKTYACYVASREWFREMAVLPFLLVVAPGKEQELRIARVVLAVLAHIPGLVIRTTTATRLADRGPLAPIWYQILPLVDGLAVTSRSPPAIRTTFFAQPDAGRSIAG